MSLYYAKKTSTTWENWPIEWKVKLDWLAKWKVKVQVLAAVAAVASFIDMRAYSFKHPLLST